MLTCTETLLDHALPSPPQNTSRLMAHTGLFCGLSAQRQRAASPNVMDAVALTSYIIAHESSGSAAVNVSVVVVVSAPYCRGLLHDSSCPYPMPKVLPPQLCAPREIAAVFTR